MCLHKLVTLLHEVHSIYNFKITNTLYMYPLHYYSNANMLSQFDASQIELRT